MKFLAMVGTILTKGNCLCYAWALMPNHYHLVLRPLSDSLSKIMLRLNGGYARYFNKRNNRKGYLFQDRFKSLATQRQDYLCELIRYVHLNPCRGGLVTSLRDLKAYQWCGHGAMMGVRHIPWQSVDEALFRFGADKKSARRAYMKFMEAGLSSRNDQKVGLISILSESKLIAGKPAEIKDDRLMGDADFVRASIATRIHC
jgi:REP element-mobilizing transposase RayT